MPPSSRSEILDSALRVVGSADGAEITYQSVAKEAGLTKAGLMYHFPTREALMVAVIEHVMSSWQADLEKTLGASMDSLTLRERTRAFVLFIADGGATRGDFAVLAEALRRPEQSIVWIGHLRTWFGFGDEPGSETLLLAWMAATGLWLAESAEILPVEHAQREALIARMLALVDEGAP